MASVTELEDEQASKEEGGTDNRRDCDRCDLPGRRGGRGGREPLERVTVNLISRASRALEQVSELTGDTKTDSINRAIQIYAYLEEVTTSGGSIYVQEAGEDEPQKIKIFS